MNPRGPAPSSRTKTVSDPGAVCLNFKAEPSCTLAWLRKIIDQAREAAASRDVAA